MQPTDRQNRSQCEHQKSAEWSKSQTRDAAVLWDVFLHGSNWGCRENLRHPWDSKVHWKGPIIGPVVVFWWEAHLRKHKRDPTKGGSFTRKHQKLLEDPTRRTPTFGLLEERGASWHLAVEGSSGAGYVVGRYLSWALIYTPVSLTGPNIHPYTYPPQTLCRDRRRGIYCDEVWKVFSVK